MQLLKRVGDCQFNIRIEGEGDPLLLVHGFPLDHQMWSFQIEGLSKTHRVIAPDLRGFGKSTIIPESAAVSPTEMQTFAEDLLAVLDTLTISQPVHLCGLSMGGYITWQLVKHARPRLRSLILCDTKATADSPEGQQGRMETATKVLNDGPDFLAEAMPAKLFSNKTFSAQPQLIKEVQATIRGTSPQAIAAALRGMAVRPDMTSLLPLIDLPTLIIVGEDDVITTAQEMRSIAAAIPQSQFVEIADAGHMAPLEQPTVVNREIQRFLQKNA